MESTKYIFKSILILGLLIVQIQTFGQTNTTAVGRINTGSGAGYKGDNSVNIGMNAGYSGGSQTKENVFVGVFSGRNNTSGDGNATLGAFSGYDIRGSQNTFLGAFSGQYANSSTQSSNVFGGYASGRFATGNANTFLGKYAGIYRTGNNNVMIGTNAGGGGTSTAKKGGSGNVFIGYQAGFNEANSNRLYIDNSNTSNPLIWGDFSSNYVNVGGRLGIGDKSPSYPLDVTGDIRSTGTIRTNSHGTSANWNTAYNERGFNYSWYRS